MSASESSLTAIVLQEITDRDVLAFVEYRTSPRIRVRHRIGRHTAWHCEACGQQMRPSCEHTRAAYAALENHSRIEKENQS